MNLPTKIKLGYQDIAVQGFTTGFKTSEAEDVFGDYCDRTGVIRIQKGMDKKTEAATLLHEILHAIVKSSGLTNDGQPLKEDAAEEMAVDVLSNGLASVFRDNPKLLEYFHKSFNKK